MADFVFVHGGWHGAWCWSEVIAELEARGDLACAMDLPGMGADLTAPSEVTLANCVAKVADVVMSRPGRVWLVGHSLGGASISQAAESLADRLEGLIYISAGMPRSGATFLQSVGTGGSSRLESVMQFDAAGIAARVPVEELRPLFYHLCTDVQVERAIALLKEWQPLAPAATPFDLSDTGFGRVPRYFVECLQDQAMDISTQRRMQKAVGVDGVVTLDADHSPFFSCPDKLADALQLLANRQQAGTAKSGG